MMHRWKIKMLEKEKKQELDNESLLNGKHFFLNTILIEHSALCPI